MSETRWTEPRRRGLFAFVGDGTALSSNQTAFDPHHALPGLVHWQVLDWLAGEDLVEFGVSGPLARWRLTSMGRETLRAMTLGGFGEPYGVKWFPQ